jgi:hypothetical protein
MQKTSKARDLGSQRARSQFSRDEKRLIDQMALIVSPKRFAHYTVTKRRTSKIKIDNKNYNPLTDMELTLTNYVI